jgi:hypothetical protein
MKIRLIGIVGTIACIAIGSIVTFAVTLTPAAILFIPFMFGPQFVSLLLAYYMPNAKSQTTIFLSSLIYLAWTVFVLVSAYVVYPDAQSGIALIFIPIYSIPIMLFAWAIATMQHYGSLDTLSNPINHADQI